MLNCLGSGILLFSLLSSCSIKKKGDSLPLDTLEGEIPVLMQDALIPGLSIAVIRDGALFWRDAFGLRSTETGEPLNKESIFEAASLSKPVFAYAVLRLVDRGELDLDKPLIDYAPESYVEENFLNREIQQF
jgi:CubicO group peptidase (beta-lactamase class C family)